MVNFLMWALVVAWVAQLLYRLYSEAQANGQTEEQQAKYRSFIGYHLGILEVFVANQNAWIDNDAKVTQLMRSLRVLPVEYVSAFYSEFKGSMASLILTKGRSACFPGCTKILACCLQIIESQSEAQSKASAEALFDKLSLS